MPWFRKPAGDPLAVSMPGVKLGDRLLVVGCSDTALIAALASKAGLTGRACILDESDEIRERAAAAVEKDGVLVESFAARITTLPFEAGAFDVVVIRNALAAISEERRLQAAAEIHRVLRPGGRCVVVDDGRRGGLAGLIGGASRTDPRYVADGGASRVLSAAGFRGVRTLAEREGLIFVEGVKPGQP
jgi:ubiquinone/menaquinone biosynthesis C-methylase UbiE